MQHYVQIRKNGSLYGIIGPYSDRSDALVDAAALKRPGLDVSVRTEGQSPATRRNYAQVAAALAPLAKDLAVNLAKSQIKKFREADQPTRIQMVRQFSYTSPVLALILRSDAQAAKFTNLLADMLPPEG